jgi:hypothetical protein
MFSKSRLGLLGLVILILIGSLSVLAGTTAADSATPPAPGCPGGQDFWKNTATWPVATLTLGSQSYTQAEVLILFNMAVDSDASLNLAQQLATAKLNVANGADATIAAGVITQGDMLLAAHADKLPYNVDPTSTEGVTMVNLAGVLDAYNSGQLTVGCLPPEETPEATLEGTPEVTPEGTPEATPEATTIPGLPITIVIEGPVQAININIITIYNINVELGDDDPALKVIQVGDIVHVDGDTEELNGTIIIVAINIVIVNVDINPTDNTQIFRDNGNCSNPPPPWAPAHGWHRRCDHQNNNSQGENGDININITINGMGDD